MSELNARLSTKGRVLFVATHCDDIELWAGGTVACYMDAGTEVYGAVLLSDPKRREEARASASILGYSIAFPDASADQFDWIEQHLREIQPQVVLTHPSDDPHYQHEQTFDAVRIALTRLDSRQAFPLRWYTFDTYYLTATSAACPVLVDISATFERKKAALACYASQNPDVLIASAEAMGTLNGCRIRTRYAEAFHPFNLLGHWPRLRDLP